MRRGVRRLDAALSKAPLKTYDTADNISGSRTKSAKEISRSSLEVRKVIYTTKNTKNTK
ncbi:MAG: hypothetical protein IKW80_08185 [Thermoguttaceae bacterium]|nr:hypothetical protein [Thermoguttaceae bacterium]